MRLIIVSGTSGSGKSIVLHALEDLGHYCIDNLPMALLPAFADEILDAHGNPYANAAVGIDARNLNHDLTTFPGVLLQLANKGLDCEVLFLDAGDATLIKRFSETRRRHPLSDAEIPLEEAIRQERDLLQPVAATAGVRFDTSKTNVYQLRDLVQQHVGQEGRKKMSLLIESFGFKNGVPVNADFVFDLRCLPNPHWEPRLRPFTGRDPEVAHFLENHFEVNRMFEEIRTFLESWIPHFEADKRSYLTVAVGCTGGQHRSVYFAERLGAHFRLLNPLTQVRHRELV